VIGLVTAAVARNLDDDLPLLGAALERAGTQFLFVEWHDNAVDWAQFSHIVLRSTWDYHLRRLEFLTWLREVSRVTTVCNSYDIVKWNSDKKYLLDLIAGQIPVIPTRFIATPSEAMVRDALDELGDDLVVKPSISAGSHDTSRYRRASANIQDIVGHVARIVASGANAMVQPYQASIDKMGETGMVYFNGVLSHAFRKDAILQYDLDMSNGLYAAEDITEREPMLSEQLLGERVINFVRQKFGSFPLYARIDLIAQPSGEPQLMELELVEPSFFLRVSPGSPDTAAFALGNACH